MKIIIDYLPASGGLIIDKEFVCGRADFLIICLRRQAVGDA